MTRGSELLRSVLFVPGSRPERFEKALEAGADAVIIDLEDAVEEERKAEARQNIVEFAARKPDASFMLRVNDASTPWFGDDLALCAQLDMVRTVVLPKAESSADIRSVADTGKTVLPIVESGKGVLALAELAGAASVDRLSFGSLDLMLELGITADTEAARVVLEHVRCQILLHSAAHGLAQPLDGVYPNFSDPDGLQRHALHVRHMGFGGMLCIHPAQIAPIHRAFAPTPTERDWARRVVEMAQTTGSSAFQVDGNMVDVPVIARARRILAQAPND